MQDDAPLVAVIDDDEPTCRAISRLLDAVGYRVRTYTNPRDYLDELDVAPPICVLVDILMPEVDGLALLREMRHAGSDVPAVFMTGTGHVPTVVEAMKEGALDLLSKPFTADSLCAAIARATDSSRRMHGERRDLVDLWRQVEKLTPRVRRKSRRSSRAVCSTNTSRRVSAPKKKR
jgi:two-component system response regulator FixJ